MEELKFKISSALKDIIGRDLITDDNIAVFELVKNAYDAYATRVDITFENIYSENSKIIIKDNGKGMSLQDIRDKWLFVAYSAKKEGTEDESFDYRDSIYQKRAFAGAKGIGRFSCDRLGRELLLESTKKGKDAKTEVIITDWTLFEENLKDEFIDITIVHETKEKSSYGLYHGTVLEITDLRSNWDRDKLLRLKRSLAKLINPSEDIKSNQFKIFLHAPEEEADDKHQEEYKNIVNGEVQNLIFDTLEIKTTKIESEIENNGKFINTSLFDGGTKIYSIKEKNPFNLLSSIKINLFYLNQSAKQTFARRMGLSYKEYGDVFVYKNGFRIYPYGEPGARDPFELDFRKGQGYGRNLGTRELMGRIDIYSKDVALKETSSRGDGFIENPTKNQFDDYFLDTLKKLEKYVVEIQSWGLGIEEVNEIDLFSFNEKSLELIQRITSSEQIESFSIGENFLKKLKETETGSTITILENIEKIAKKEKDETLLSDAKRISKELKNARKATEEERKLRQKERNLRYRAEQKLKEEESENLFLRSIKSQDLEDVVSFLHHVRISSTLIEKKLKNLLFEINKDNAEKGKILKYIEGISLENKKINSVARFATKANFKLYTSETEVDIVNYIEEYINNILSVDPEQEPKITLKNKGIVFDYKIKPIELNIIFDNLISNSRKANAHLVEIDFSLEGNELIITYTDDGHGLPEIDNKSKIFDLGFTTTGGSGIGLHHVKQILKRINGDIDVLSQKSDGVQFIIKIKNKDEL